MGGKAKPTKHTTKELQQKAKDALINKGAGAAGIKDRQGGSAGHAKYACVMCGMAAPSEKSASEHWESKHKKLGAFDINNEAHWKDMHAAAGGVTTSGVGVRGGINVKHK
mmetsp:Transcript_27849/g.70387  ORF Transcript_27849/g.70387 Transcript_27849/m.70387 type:complete len:110 (+) Transcript_27849:262-591(+)|eukprot:CAMPEP_0178988584 /NCGR_PEP_ID=MMETSP0795-20121207/3886_1 /TAXON_ID=88552 /ORGANISM="Amoebophrya sp., Strain Ameob2" /LENGTH=109 /DNA_ID=CAMNT_0020679863 /DNA_START=337 /DNA_END=666 /DNA_ORIENTATION=+